MLALAAPAAAHVRLGEGGTGSKVIAGDSNAGSPKVIAGDSNAGSPKVIAGDSNAGSPKVIAGDSNAGSPKVIAGDSNAGSPKALTGKATPNDSDDGAGAVAGALLLALAGSTALIFYRRRHNPLHA